MASAHLPTPALELREDTPVSAEFDDVYFSRAGGVAETEHVFLKGNGLPQRWQLMREGGLAPYATASLTPAASGSAEPTHALTHENSSLPDLILIDGGLGQLHAVEEALASISVAGLNLVAIAKGVDRNAGREWFHIPNREPFQLPVNDPTLHYLQRLRDEAHRFAIGRHRNKRSKSFTQSALDDIPSIGPTRKKALLQHFGSRADVETATLEELQKVKGINRATAQAIYDYFHG